MGVREAVSLFKRLSLTMIALVVSTAVTIWTLAYVSMSSAIVPAALNALKLRTGPLVTLIETQSNQASSDILALSQSGIIDGMLETSSGATYRGWDSKTWAQQLERRFQAELASKPDYVQLRLIGAEDGGRELVRVDRSRMGAPVRVVSGKDLQQKGDRDYFKDASRRAVGTIYVSELDYNQEYGIKDKTLPVLRVATPVRRSSGELFGVLIVNVDMGPTIEALHKHKSPYSNLYLINDRGDYLVHPDRAREFQFETDVPFRLKDEFPEIVALAGATKPTMQVVDIGDKNAGVTVWPIELAGQRRLTLISILPGDILYASVNTVRDSSLLGGAIAIVCAVGAALLSARALAKPLTRMTEAVSGLRSGQMLPLPVDAGGEIGNLAKAIYRLSESGGAASGNISFSDEPLMSMTLDGYITMANKAAGELFRFTPADIIGRNISLLIPPERRGELLTIGERVKKGLRIDGFNTVRQTLDGQQIQLLLTILPIESPEGEIVGWSTISRDLTAQARHDQRIRELQVDAAHAERISAAGEMVASLAHEINQPLAAVVNYMNSVRHRIKDVEVPKVAAALEYIDKAVAQAQRASKIVGNLRDFVERRQLRRSRADVAEVFNDGLDLALTGRHGISIRRHIARDMPAVPMQTTQVQQVIINLVRNAVEAMHGTEAPELTMTVETTDDGFVHACFADNGPGLPPDRVSNLFQPFKSSKSTGMGIGLIICRSIVEAHNGRIWAQNNVGGGATFCFSLSMLDRTEVDNAA